MKGSRVEDVAKMKRWALERGRRDWRMLRVMEMDGGYRGREGKTGWRVGGNGKEG